MFDLYEEITPEKFLEWQSLAEDDDGDVAMNRLAFYWVGHCHWNETGGMVRNREAAIEAWKRAANMENNGEDGLGMAFAKLVDVYPPDSPEYDIVHVHGMRKLIADVREHNDRDAMFLLGRWILKRCDSRHYDLKKHAGKFFYRSALAGCWNGLWWLGMMYKIDSWAPDNDTEKPPEYKAFSIGNFDSALHKLPKGHPLMEIAQRYVTETFNSLSEHEQNYARCIRSERRGNITTDTVKGSIGKDPVLGIWPHAIEKLVAEDDAGFPSSHSPIFRVIKYLVPALQSHKYN
jgi:TPR repeat protein